MQITSEASYHPLPLRVIQKKGISLGCVSSLTAQNIFGKVFRYECLASVLFVLQKYHFSICQIPQLFNNYLFMALTWLTGGISYYHIASHLVPIVFPVSANCCRLIYSLFLCSFF